MKKILFLKYGLAGYASFLVTILYAIGFVGNLWVPKGIDAGAAGPAGPSILINVLLMALFAIQHTVMARPAFKRIWTKIVPEPLERSTFVLFTSAVLLLLFWQWRPMPEVVWEAGNALAAKVLLGVYFAGWAMVFYSSFLIDHFDLFGMRQVALYFQGKAYSPKPFRTPGLYRYVRNPLMLGFVIMMWSAPMMSQGRLLFALVVTAYIFIGIRFEEKDIGDALGEEYARYRAATPMIFPRFWKRSN